MERAVRILVAGALVASAAVMSVAGSGAVDAGSESSHVESPPHIVERNLSAADGRAFFAEFTSPLSGAERDALTSAGATFAQAVPPSTYVVRLAPGAVAEVNRHPGFVGLEPLVRDDKLTPALRAGEVPARARTRSGAIRGTVAFFADVELADALAAADDAGVTVTDRTRFLFGSRLDVVGSSSALHELAVSSAVRYMSEAAAPKKVTNSDAQIISNVPVVHAQGTTGAGVILGIWDGGPVLSTHGDLTGRVTVNDTAEPLSDHATHVAGTMIGSGAGDVTAQGMAPGVTDLQSYDFEGDVPTEIDDAIETKNIVASNHSWGITVGWDDGTQNPEDDFGAYISDTSVWDELIHVTDHIQIKAAGNDRGECNPVDPTDCDGFIGIDGMFYDTIGPLATAKNVITVGAIADDGTTITDFSSAGPADDGRIKPDVVANGLSVHSTSSSGGYFSEDGTSMASPVVTGIVALIEEVFREHNDGEDIPADAAKAVLVNTATDLGRMGPDYLYGFGLVDAEKATAASLLDPDQHRIVFSELEHEAVDLFRLTSTGDPLSLTLAWVDVAGVPDSDAPDLVNDLDLALTAPDGTTTHFPFTGPGRANPTGPATTAGPNTIDNVEQIRLATPAAGTWTVRITGTGITAGPQNYALVSTAPLCLNDDFAIAKELTGTSTVDTADNTSATAEPGEPSHDENQGHPASHSLWWQWTAPGSGEVTVLAESVTFDTVLGVYTGTALGSLTTIARNDDIDLATTNSQVTFTVTAGETYLIAVDGWSATEIGSFNLALGASLEPGAPNIVSVQPSSGSVAVVWTAPVSNGGNAITKYTVTSSPGGKTCTTAGLTCTVSGLTNGTVYRFTATATNVAGTGPVSNLSPPVTPFGLPGAPNMVSVQPSSGSVAVVWTAPVSNGGNAITKYTVTSSPGGKTCTTVGLTCTVSGLTNGTVYRFTATATNVAGTGPVSNLSPPVTPFGLPGAPNMVSVQPSSGSVAVVWTAPVSNGGNAITKYTVTSSPGGKTCTTVGLTCTVSGLTNGTVYRFTATATNLAGTGPVSNHSPPVTPASGFTSVNPARLFESRAGEKTVDGKFQAVGRLAAGAVAVFQVTGRAGIPVGAASASLNVVAVLPAGPGYLTVYPCDEPRPIPAASVNYDGGDVRPNAVLSKLSATGTVCVYTLQATDLVVDINGSFAAGSGFTSVNPARLYESRAGEKTVDGKFQGVGRLGGGAVAVFQVAGRAGIAADADSVSLNVVAVNSAGPGYLTVYPCDKPRPIPAASVNYDGGDVRPNAVLSKLSATGTVCVYTLQATDLVVDVNGAVAAGSGFTAVNPARLFESRPGEKTADGVGQFGRRLGAGEVIEVQVTGRIGIASDAESASLNVVAVFPSAPGFLTVYPCDKPRPIPAASVNYDGGDVRPNAVLSKLSATGTVCVYTLRATDLVIDINGAFG